MRLGMIHQPHFLPWPGYIARCLAADVIVLLDNVKFNKNHFQHRTKFIGKNGAEAWLSLPIAHSTLAGPISQVEVATSFRTSVWQRRFEESYRGSPDFDPLWRELYFLIGRGVPSLLNIAVSTLSRLIEFTSAAGETRLPRIVPGSSLHATTERTGRLADLCAEQQISHLMMGRDAMQCHDCDSLRNGGLVLVHHVFSGPNERRPQPGVTVLHDIFTLGGVETARRLKSDWSVLPSLDAQ
jgi:hypothetical protein